MWTKRIEFIVNRKPNKKQETNFQKELLKNYEAIKITRTFSTTLKTIKKNIKHEHKHIPLAGKTWLINMGQIMIFIKTKKILKKTFLLKRKSMLSTKKDLMTDIGILKKIMTIIQNLHGKESKKGSSHLSKKCWMIWKYELIRIKIC